MFLLHRYPLSKHKQQTILGSKLLVGYWHNFDNGTGIIKLKDVSPKWDVINVSLVKLVVIVPLLNFLLCMVQMQTSNQISYLKSKGKKVVLSNRWTKWSRFTSDNAAKDRFINSIQSLNR